MSLRSPILDPVDVLPVMNGLAGWWRVDDVANLPSGSGCGFLPDRSGQGYHLTQATGASRPTWLPNALNRRAALTFDGADDYLGNASAVQTPAGLSVFVVMQWVTAFAFNMVTSVEEVAAAEYAELRCDAGGTVFQVTANVADVVDGGAVAAGTWQRACQSCTNGANNQLWLNGGLSAQIAMVGDIATINNFSVGGRMATLFANIKVAEIALFRRGLTAGEIGALDTYFKTIYGL